MTKRTASMKPVETKDAMPKMTREDIKKVFEESVKGLLLKVEAQIKQTRRADAVLALYREAKELKVLATDNTVFSTLNHIEDHLRCVATAIADLDFESFIADEYKDPIADMIIYCEGMIPLDDVFKAAYTFESIRPYGEQLEQLRYQILGNLEAIETNK